jgi:serine/threonine-protein kinase HipA
MVAMNRKRDGFTREDFRAFGDTASMKRGRADSILDEVIDAVKQWPDFADEARVSEKWNNDIRSTHRVSF